MSKRPTRREEELLEKLSEESKRKQKKAIEDRQREERAIKRSSSVRSLISFPRVKKKEGKPSTRAMSADRPTAPVNEGAGPSSGSTAPSEGVTSGNPVPTSKQVDLIEIPKVPEEPLSALYKRYS